MQLQFMLLLLLLILGSKTGCGVLGSIECYCFLVLFRSFWTMAKRFFIEVSAFESECFCIGLCSTSYFLFLLVWWLVRAVCALGVIKKKLVGQVITWHTLYGHARYKKKRIAENILWQETDKGTGKVLTKRNIDSNLAFHCITGTC